MNEPRRNPQTNALVYKDDIAKEALQRLFGMAWPEVLGEIAVSNRAEVLITMPVSIINVGSKRDETNNVVDYGIWISMGKGRMFIPWRLIHAFEPWGTETDESAQ